MHIGATAFVGLQVKDATGGVAVQVVVPGSPAESSGLVQGDVLTSIDGTPLSSFKDLRTILFGHHPGDSITIGYTDPLGNASTATLALASGPPQQRLHAHRVVPAVDVKRRAGDVSRLVAE